MGVAQGRQRRLLGRNRLVFVLFGLAVLLVGALARADVQYAYDPDGRLVQIVAADGSSAVYQYDAAGNITSILRLAAGQLAVVTPSSTSSAPGTTVTIQGSGFSTTCGNDVVTFNGVAATVISCSANQLVVQVPNGATTGPISVTVSGQTVSTSQTFSVPPAPVISSFSPAIVNLGATVTISGTNLAPGTNSTHVAVGGTGVRTTSVASTQVAFTSTGSGAITVTTPYGRTTSATGLITVPASVGATNVISSATLTENGGSQSITVNQASKFGLISFDGTVNQFVSVQVAGLTTSPSGSSVAYQVFTPNGVQFSSGSISASSPSIHLPKLTSSGTYVVTFGSGSLTSLTLSASVEVNQTINVGAAPLSVATAAPGQSKRFVFAGTAGQNLALALTSMALTPTTPNNYLYPYIYKPDNSLLTDPNCYTSSPGPSCNVTMYNLPQTGIYTLVMQSPPQQQMSFNASIVQAVSATLTSNTPQSVSLPAAGQYAVLSFTAAAGQEAALQLSSVTTAPANQYVSATVYNPSGTQVTSLSSNGTNSTVNLTNLVAGTYTIVAIPGYAATANFQMTFGSGVQGTLPTDGTSTSVTTNVPGQSVYYTFSGTAGQNLALVLSNMALSPTTPNNYIYPYVYTPGGSLLTDPNCYTSNPGDNCNVTMYNLPQTGTYSVRFDSPPQQKMSFNVSIVKAVNATLAPNTPQSVSLPTNGQYAVLTFTATAGQDAALQLSSVTTTPASQYIAATLYNPSGAQVTSLSSNGTNSTINLTNLVAGTYTIVAIPGNAATGSFQMTFGSGVQGTLPADGTSTSVNTNVPGQSAYYTFSGTAGQNLALVLSNMALSPTTPNNYIYPYVYTPTGGLLTDPNCYTSNPGDGCNVTMYNLPQTGTYTVRFDSPPQQQMSFNVSIVQAVTATLAANTPQTVSLPTAGQYAVLSFTATAGQDAALQLSSVTTVPASQYITATLYNPSGAQVTGLSSNGSNSTINLTNLVAGTYTIVAIPNYAATGSFQMTFGGGVQGTLPTDGTSTSVSTNVPGQSAYYTFSGTAGQNLALNLSSMALNPTGPNNYIYPYVYAPNGSLVVDPNCYTTNPGDSCNVTMYNLPQTGTYSVRFDSPPQQQMSFNVSIVQAVTATLAANTPQTVSLPTAGQYAVLSFTATAGQDAALQLSSVTTAPANQYVSATVYNPSGAQVTSLSSNGTNTTINLTNLIAGTYKIVAVPSYAATGSFQMTVGTGAQGTLPTDGTSTSVSTNVPGQSAYYTFSGTAGQSLALVLSNMALSPGTPSNYIYPYVFAPNGSLVTDPNCYTTNPGDSCNVTMYNLPQTGTYSVRLDSPASQKMSVTLTIPQAVTATLVAGTPQSLSLPSAGQFEVLSFTATAGQSGTLQLSSVSTVPSGQSVIATVFNPSGSQVTSLSSSGATASANLTNLSAGTYRIVVVPNYAATASAQVSLQ